jgi:hypothetical protein
VKQAKKTTTTKKDSDTKFPPVSVGSPFRILVPDVDRGRADARNILALLIKVTEEGFSN